MAMNSTSGRIPFGPVNAAWMHLQIMSRRPLVLATWRRSKSGAVWAVEAFRRKLRFKEANLLLSMESGVSAEPQHVP